MFGFYGDATQQTPKKADGWAVVQQAVDTFGPLVTDIVGAATEGGRNTPTWLAGQIAKKQGQLATETNPVKRAKLEAEIQALKQQQRMYSQATDASMTTLLNSGGAGVGGTLQQSVQAPPPAQPVMVSTWLPWVGLGFVAVVGVVLVTQTGRAGRRAA